jgi:N-acyl-D-amino-acid deacylase
VLRGGWVVDGTGAPRRRADVVVRGGRIDAVLAPGSSARAPDVPGARTIDVDGLVVAPGFIDMHAHSDLAVLFDREHLAKTLQGVTTEVCGQDGLSYVPASAATSARMTELLVGWNGAPPQELGLASVGDYLDRLDAGAPVNVAYLVPHGTIRYEVLGDEQREASPRELEAMLALVTAGMQDGAFGVSTGLTYVPGMYASDEELVAVAALAGRLGGYHCTHHRNYGARAVEGYREAIGLARIAGAPLHLAHCHLNFPHNRGRAHELLAEIDAALAEGLDITLDTYPYLDGATYLHALLPSWVQGGGVPAVLARLADPAARERVIHELEVVGSDGHHGVPIAWDTIVVAGVGDPALAARCGRTIAELAREGSRRPGDVYLDLLVADRLRSSCRVAVGDEENVRAIMRHRVHTVGTDGILVGDAPHPRGWGSFPRILGHYVRELGLLTLEDAVAHMTGRAAARLGLDDRGVVAAGRAADLVVLDPDTVGSAASYEDPRRGPDGIVHVFVNGERTVTDGRRTDLVPGRSLRGPAHHSAKDPSSWNHSGGRQA